MPFPAPILINGEYPDYSRITLQIHNTQNFLGVKEISYSDGCEPGEARANQQQRLATSPGEYKAEGSMTMYKRHSQEMIRNLGQGFYAVRFNIIVVYRMEDGGPAITDTIAGVRLKKNDNSHKQGSDPLEVKWDLDVSYVLWDGIAPLREMRL